MRAVQRSLPLAVSLGDPSGIGPELILKAWLHARDEGALPPFIVIGDPAFLAAEAHRLGLGVAVESADPSRAAKVFARALPVCDFGHRIVAEPGRPNAASARAVIASIERTVRLVRDGSCAGVVTSPIAKHVLQEAGFPYVGHTDYLGALATELWGVRALPVMLLWSQDLAVVPVTVHIPLAEVPARLTTELIVETGRIVARDLAARFGVPRPRLAFTGVNPHAGESATIGSEEATVIGPAIARLRREGIAANGPYPADSLFHAKARAGYDVALAMYHDQALIPIKTIAFDEAVNVTLGLPFVRTSPDHGTAFDIAGRGMAEPASFIAALRLAGRLTRTEHAAAAE